MAHASCPDQEREAGEDEEQYALSRFVPLLQEVLEDHASSALSTDDYPYVSAPPLASGAPPDCLFSDPKTTPTPAPAPASAMFAQPAPIDFASIAVVTHHAPLKHGKSHAWACILRLVLLPSWCEPRLGQSSCLARGISEN